MEWFSKICLPVVCYNESRSIAINNYGHAPMLSIFPSFQDGGVIENI